MSDDDIPAGWYPDPDDNGISQRWWDGYDWTDHTQRSPAARPKPTPYASSVATKAAAPARTSTVAAPEPHPVPPVRQPNWLVRHKLLTALAVIAVIVIASVAGTSGNKTTPTGQGVSTAPAGQNPTAKTPARKTARLGDAIALTGTGGSKITVTLLRVVSPAHATDGFSTPDAGKHFAAVQIKLTNTGSSSYTDSPANGAEVLDAQGQSYSADIGVPTDAGPAFANEQVNLAPGSSEVGVLTFQVPDGLTVAKFQFGLDSGFAQTGEWTVS